MKAAARLKWSVVCAVLLFAVWPGFPAETAAPKEIAPKGVKLLNAPGIHNLYQLGTNVISGSAPEGEEAFAALAKLGVKTIISVDGSKPNLELAHKYGMKYVHLPHGYDGIPGKTQTELVKASKVVEGPIFVHCHHGTHRGPAAAAVICMADNGWSAADGLAWLKTAGTGTNYLGLFQSVREFRAPTAAELGGLPSSFPEMVKVSGLIQMMVEIDERWDHLKAIRKAGYQTPKDHPDIQPAQEALILSEHYREAQRLPEAVKHGADFLERLKSAEAGAVETEKLLRQFVAGSTAELRTRLDQSFDALGQKCAACHKAYRDPTGSKGK